MKTGTEVGETGAYCSDCCDVMTKLERNQMFPRCPACKKLTVWDQIEEEEAAA